MKHLNSATGAVLIAGAAPHSIGEAFADIFLSDTNSPLIILDIRNNPAFKHHRNCVQIKFDLYPFHGELRSFHHKLNKELVRATTTLKTPVISAIILFAGLYDRGPLTKSAAMKRATILGVNLIGRVELVASVLSFNDAAGFARNHFTLIDIGSKHGLATSPDRALYCTSKSASLDFCASLLRGHEIGRALHICPGQVDSQMLHKNHWVKAGGKENDFVKFSKLEQNTYCGLLKECELRFFESVYPTSKLNAKALSIFQSYSRLRRNAFKRSDGVHSTSDCAQKVFNLMTNNKMKSGVYLLEKNKKRAITFASFQDVNRLQLLRKRGKSL